MKKTICCLCTMICAIYIAQAQGGQVRGTAYNESKEPLPFTKVWVFTPSDSLYGTAQCDIDGEYTVTDLPSGKYNILYTAENHTGKRIISVIVQEPKITFLNVKLPYGANAADSVITEHCPAPSVTGCGEYLGAGVTALPLVPLKPEAGINTVPPCYIDCPPPPMVIRGRHGNAIIFVDGIHVRGQKPKEKTYRGLNPTLTGTPADSEAQARPFVLAGTYPYQTRH